MQARVPGLPPDTQGTAEGGLSMCISYIYIYLYLYHLESRSQLSNSSGQKSERSSDVLKMAVGLSPGAPGYFRTFRYFTVNIQ